MEKKRVQKREDGEGQGKKEEGRRRWRLKSGLR